MRVGLGVLRHMKRRRGVVLVGTALILTASMVIAMLVPRLTTRVTHAAATNAPDTVGVVVPASGTNLYYLRYSNTPGYADKAIVFGSSSMVPMTGDWDGHGVSTIGAYDQSRAEFWLSDFNESGGPVTYGFFFGSPGDIPLAGHWTTTQYGDTVGVYDPATSTFSWTTCTPADCSPIPVTQSVQFGIPGDIPLVGDWMGTGVDSIGVYQPATGMFYLDTTPHSGGADYAIRYGPIGATPITGDWTGSGHTGIGVVYNGVFYLKNDPLTSGFADTAFPYGPPGATPIVGHFVSPSALAKTAWPDIASGNDVFTRNRLTEGPDGNIWITATYPSFRQYPSYGVIVRLAPLPGAAVYNPSNVTNFSPLQQRLVDPTRITTGPDGNLWFGDDGSGYIGKITTSGSFTLYTPPHGVDFEGVAAGPDGALWYTVKDANEILRVTTSGGFTEYPIPTPDSQPTAITAGPDGALWFTENGASKIGRISTSGTITEYAASATAGASAVDNIVTGPDGNLWYSLTNTSSATPGHLVKMSTAGAILAEYAVTVNPIADVTSGPDGNLWFIDSSEGSGGGLNISPADVGKVTTSGTATLYPQNPYVGFSSQSNGIISVPNANIWAGTAEYDLH